MATYNFELYNSQNQTQTLIADITDRIKQASFTVPLNNYEQLSFQMDTYDWLNYCSKTAIDPYITLVPFTAEVKIKRNGSYLPMVFEIVQSPKTFGDSSSIQINARGTLSKLAYRVITKNYTNMDACDIARDVIATSETFAASYSGAFGITNGNTFQIGVPSQRTYQTYSCMTAITELSNDASGGFDFYFDHNWAFYTMAKRGNTWTDITYIFDELTGNVISYEDPSDASGLYNQVIAVGMGIGDPMISAPTIDAVSARTYGLRQTALQYSNIQNQSWLDSTAAAELRDRKDMYDLPSITVGGDIFDLSTRWVGDTIQVKSLHPVAPYVGNGRIKTITVNLDDNLQESIALELLKV